MLTQLTIKNYALIDELQVSFNNGLTIITGETGAGKSILLGGLSLILGKRAEITSVKDSSKKCVIEGVFDITKYKLKSLFTYRSWDYESITIIRREILPSGKSRAFINDTPVRLDDLQVLGKHLIDIHSQHQTLQLTNDNFQFQIIDALANNAKILSEYNAELKYFKKITSEISVLQNQKSAAVKALDYNVFLLKELKEVTLVDGELVLLEKEFETLNNIEAIKDTLNHSQHLLSHEETGVSINLRDIKLQLSKLVSYGEQYQSIYDRIDSSLIELDDIFNEIETLQDQIDINPNRLEVVSAKLHVLQHLMHKHTAASIAELIALRDELEAKVLVTENLDDSILEKEKEKLQVISKLQVLSKSIHNNRSQAIPKLVQQLESILAELGMPNAKFNIQLVAVNTFLSNGSDDLEFLFSANKGGQFNDLKKAASGGELSRIMLAIKHVLSKYTQLPSIMFDEIDTGVSGEISQKMGAIMQDMSKTMQVFTITHLPQIASKGDHHFKVYKEDINELTQTQLKKLTAEDRVVEIAQMLGGSNVSNSALEHAKQLLN
jgi:DNA repair protein RecN (Recombination protein N)